MNSRNNHYHSAIVFLCLTLVCGLAYVLGGGPSAYSPPMNAVPIVMLILTMHSFWKAFVLSKKDGERR